MQSRRSFFGALLGLGALLPLPAFARTEAQPLGEFYHPTLDPDFLELPKLVSVYAWTQTMNLARETNTPQEHIVPVLRIKITILHHIDMPVMFNKPNSRQRYMLPEFQWNEETQRTSGADTLEGVLAKNIDSYDTRDDVHDGWPVWITQHSPNEPVRHRMACMSHEVTVDDMVLALPVGLAATGINIYREPPNQFDAGEDGPWRAA